MAEAIDVPPSPNVLPFQNEPPSPDVAILDITFVHAIRKDCFCALCDQLMKEPCHLTCCGANYCKKCVERMRIQSLACVKCRSNSYSMDVDQQDKDLESTILGLTVYCPLKAQGCPWTGRLQSLEDHLQWGVFNPSETVDCRYLPVKCPNGCNVDVPRRKMERHLQMECTNREKKCEFCGERGIADHIDNVHRESCTQRIVECPNSCKMSQIRQNRLSVHLEAECPLRIVPCSYARIGCSAQVQFNKFMEHNDISVHDHFRLMSKKLDDVDKENDELRSMCHSVESTCSKLQEQFSMLHSLLCSEKRESKLTDATGESEEVSYFSIHNQQSVRRLMRAMQHPPIHHNRMAWLSSSSDDGEAPPLPPRGYSMSDSAPPLADPRTPSRPVSSRGSDSVFEKGGNISDLGGSVSSASSRRDGAQTVEHVKRVPPPLPPRSDSLSGPALKEKAKQATALARHRNESSNSDVFLPAVSSSENLVPTVCRDRRHTSNDIFRGLASSVGENLHHLAPLGHRIMSLPSLLDHVEEQAVFERDEEEEEEVEQDEPQILVSAEANPCYVTRTSNK